MLVLSRKLGEGIVIGNGVELTVLNVQGDRVKLGFKAPEEVSIHREEVHQRIKDCLPVLEYARCV
ncbi:MAG: carbon storage regulator CsrA [Pirellulales bacterium]|nr:carbon storage regulator CsrA [Pirellulales bacterium]